MRADEQQLLQPHLLSRGRKGTVFIGVDLVLEVA